MVASHPNGIQQACNNRVAAPATKGNFSVATYIVKVPLICCQVLQCRFYSLRDILRPSPAGGDGVDRSNEIDGRTDVSDMSNEESNRIESIGSNQSDRMNQSINRINRINQMNRLRRRHEAITHDDQSPLASKDRWPIISLSLVPVSNFKWANAKCECIVDVRMLIL
jgi:hypothetical protein